MAYGAATGCSPHGRGHGTSRSPWLHGSSAKCTTAYFAQILSRTHTRGATECCQAPHYSQGSPKEEMALQLLDLKTGLAPPGLFSDYRQAMVLEWVPLSCSQNARQGGKGHSMHYFWLGNRLGMVSLSITHPPSYTAFTVEVHTPG